MNRKGLIKGMAYLGITLLLVIALMAISIPAIANQNQDLSIDGVQIINDANIRMAASLEVSKYQEIAMTFNNGNYGAYKKVCSDMSYALAMEMNSYYKTYIIAGCMGSCSGANHAWIVIVDNGKELAFDAVRFEVNSSWTGIQSRKPMTDEFYSSHYTEKIRYYYPYDNFIWSLRGD